MKKLKKILFISLLLCFSAFDIIFAESDCKIFGNMQYNHNWATNWFDIVNMIRWTGTYKYTNFLTVEEQNAIITKDDLNTAILNLKKYCCTTTDKWILWEEICKNDYSFFNDNSLDSKYLFDHIFDVVMRRLKWLDGSNNIYTNTKMTLDDKWAEWRKLIDEHAENIKWASPQIIINEYSDFWKQSSPASGINIAQNINSTFENSNPDFLTYVSGNWSWEDSKMVAKAMKNYKDWTLYDRYNNACALSKYFYWLLSLWSNTSETDKATIIRNTANNSCENFVKNQVRLESEYVSLVIKTSSTLFLTNYIEWYMSYMNDRQERFQKLWKDSADRWLDVIRAVPCLQTKCSK
jgi:hypothetical protein